MSVNGTELEPTPGVVPVAVALLTLSVAVGSEVVAALAVVAETWASGASPGKLRRSKVQPLSAKSVLPPSHSPPRNPLLNLSLQFPRNITSSSP